MIYDILSEKQSAASSGTGALKHVPPWSLRMYANFEAVLALLELFVSLNSFKEVCKNRNTNLQTQKAHVAGVARVATPLK